MMKLLDICVVVTIYMSVAEWISFTGTGKMSTEHELPDYVDILQLFCYPLGHTITLCVWKGDIKFAVVPLYLTSLVQFCCPWFGGYNCIASWIYQSTISEEANNKEVYQVAVIFRAHVFYKFRAI